MPIQKPDDVCVEAVETSDLVDELLILIHFPIIFKLLDLVK